MASIDKYSNSTKGETYRVRWYSKGQPQAETFATEKDAYRWKNIIEAAGGDTDKATNAILNQLETGPTVHELITRHIDQLTGVGDYQRKRYKSALRDHFTDGIGQIKILRVTSEDVVDWQRQMQEKNLSPKTIANHRGLLSAAFTTGIRLRLIEHNPVSGVRLPKDNSTKEKMQIIPMHQWRDLMDVMEEHYVPFSWMLLYSGARFGEVTALQRQDFTTLGSTPVMRINKAWKEDAHHQFFLGAPKTPKARRTVSLSQNAELIVRDLLKGLPAAGTVFKTTQGKQIRSSGYHKVWAAAWSELDVAKEYRPRPHDIRHTHASMMLAAGMDMYELSRRLGHESVRTTVDRYSHLVEGAHARGASIADQAFG